MFSGVAKTGVACTAVYQYTVSLADDLISTGYLTRKARQCRFCTTTYSSSAVYAFLDEYTPPTTSTRKIKGISIWSADSAGAMMFTQDTIETT